MRNFVIPVLFVFFTQLAFGNPSTKEARLASLRGTATRQIVFDKYNQLKTPKEFVQVFMKGAPAELRSFAQSRLSINGPLIPLIKTANGFEITQGKTQITVNFEGSTVSINGQKWTPKPFNNLVQAMKDLEQFASTVLNKKKTGKFDLSLIPEAHAFVPLVIAIAAAIGIVSVVFLVHFSTTAAGCGMSRLVDYLSTCSEDEAALQKLVTSNNRPTECDKSEEIWHEREAFRKCVDESMKKWYPSYWTNEASTKFNNFMDDQMNQLKPVFDGSADQ